MMTPQKKIEEKVRPLVELALSELPAGFSRDLALTKVQEFLWWSDKAIQDKNMQEAAKQP